MKAMLKLLATSAVITLMACGAQASDEKTNKAEGREVLTSGLNHVGLTVSNLEKSVAFFVETLDWKNVGGFPDYPSVFVTDGEIFVTLWQSTDPENTVPFDRKNNVGLHHLALTVTSFEALDELHERFKKTDGVVIEFAPELNGGGPTKHMMIREPSGNRLEFAHTPPRE